MSEYYEPRTVQEACELVARHADDGKVLAGGTALVLFMRQQLLRPEHLINIQRIDGLGGIHVQGGEITIRALTTHAQAARSSHLRDQYPALAETFAKVATPRIRNAGTVGGNLAHGDPHLDPPVTLLALDAWVDAESSAGQRRIPLRQFFRDYYETALHPDEILTQVGVPVRKARCGLAFIKFLPRSQDDYAAVDVAVWLRLAQNRDGVEAARIALGSVGPVPLRAFGAERVLEASALEEDALAEAGRLAAAACDPESDVRGSTAYKRELVSVLVGRAIRKAVADAARADGQDI